MYRRDWPARAEPGRLSSLLAVFADTLLRLETAHLLRLALWGAASVLSASAMCAVLAVRRVRSPLLFHFAVQTAAWGGLEVVLAALGWRDLVLRDLAGATRLDRMLWLDIGLDVGYLAVGLTLALAGWGLGRRLGAVGAGLGVALQGVALLALDTRFVALLLGMV
jgi:hypothetical protein